MLSATITSDVQKYHALIALGRLFDAQFRTAFPLACMATSDITRQLRSAILLLSGGAGLWHLAAATHHANATLRSTATEVLKLAIAYSPSQILESHMQSMVRLQELLSRYSASRSPNNALDLLKYGVTAVNHQHMYYAWVASKTSRLLLQDHGRAQVNTWLQQLVPELGVIVEQFIEKNDWKCSLDAADVNPDLASSGLKRALFASKCIANTAACSQLYHEYLNCYVVATADKDMFAKFGGPYSRVHCMKHYHAALMCSYTNEEACFSDFQPKSPLGPSILTRVASTRFGPMMFFSPDYYFRVGLGLYGEWSYLEAAKMQAAVREGATVIDVGTHIGTMLLAFAEKVGPTGRVIGIEAQRSLASVAAHNAAVNGHAHVQVINAAVDSSATTCIMSYESQSNEDISNYGGFGVRLCSPSMYQACALSPTGCAPYPAPDVSVVDDEDARLYSWLPAITIDSLQLQRCDLIKFDVEGWESRALRGAAQTISRFKPVLFFEADEAADSAQGSSFTSPFVEEHLHPLGYICFRLSFPLYNEHNFNNVTANFFGQSQSIMVTCSVGSTAEAEPRAAVTEL
jgi:FkbM family methyltransferase